jgi:hypothetical protein
MKEDNVEGNLLDFDNVEEVMIEANSHAISAEVLPKSESAEVPVRKDKVQDHHMDQKPRGLSFDLNMDTDESWIPANHSYSNNNSCLDVIGI